MDESEQPALQPEQPQSPKRRKRLITLLVILDLVLIVAAVGWFVFLRDSEPQPSNDSSQEQQRVLVEPKISTETVVEGLSNIWDVVFPDSNTAIFTTRGGTIYGVSLDSKERWEIATVPNVWASGEGGLLGLALDNEFADNRYVYACHNVESPRSVHVTRFTLSQDFKSAGGFTDIITDIQSQAGRHSGCRLAMDKQNVLWVGTGDSAIRTAPQDPKSLAGKVLRVDRDGKPVSDNLPEPFDSRIFNYGHRNIQGLVLFDEPAANGAVGLTAEHGSNRDDEINWLLPGNFGWDPNTSKGTYDESVPMTDSSKYPNAVPAVWSSGSPTIAVSGLTILKHDRWSAWQGRVVMAVLKDKHVRLINFTGDGKIESEAEILKDFGRIRSVNEAPDGNLYITTDNGGGKDKIIRVIPE